MKSLLDLFKQFTPDEHFDAIRIGMASALLVGAALFAAKNLGYIASKGEASGVAGAMLVVAIVGNLVLGALMTIGIGLYAPCMLLVSFIGMNERAAFPIMMGSCAFLMTGATKPFVDKGSYSLKSALGLALGPGRRHQRHPHQRRGEDRPGRGPSVLDLRRGVVRHRGHGRPDPSGTGTGRRLTG